MQLEIKSYPSTNDNPIASLLVSARAYIDAQSDKNGGYHRVLLLLAGVNDQVEHVRESPTCSMVIPVRSISFRSTIFLTLASSYPSNAVSCFLQVLMEAGFIVTVRTTRGDDIIAACGQLVEMWPIELSDRRVIVHNDDEAEDISLA